MIRAGKNNLHAYAAFTAAFLALGTNINAQAIYTDLDPDVVLDEDWEVKYIDMDANGSTDFILWNRSYWSTTEYGDYDNYQRIWAGPNIHDNAIAGSGSIWSTGYKFFPYAMFSGEPINSSLQLNTAFFQKMAFRTYFDFSPPNHGGNWYPEIYDHYLGVRFIDSLDCNHYGWIRCDVMDEGRTLIIKDFAYEKKCGHAINAGDIIGDTTDREGSEPGGTITGILENGNNGFNIYSYGSSIYILAPDSQSSSYYKIYDIHGSEIYYGRLNAGVNTISITSAAGIYLVDIYSENIRISHKVRLD